MDLSVFDFMEMPGEDDRHQIILIGLSTCGFCKKAIEFLNENSISYKYLFIDKIPAEKKILLKEEFKKEYGKSFLYPTAIIDGKEILNGFIRLSWENTLGISTEK